MDKVYDAMFSEFKGKIYFRKLNWEERGSKAIIAGQSLVSPPSSVLADARGHVVRKFEGSKSSNIMKNELKALLRGDKKR